MSDAGIASIARNLAQALSRRAYERDVESYRAVAALQTELCQAFRSEQNEEAQTKTTHNASEGNSDDRTTQP